ncbi:cysteine desulfurase [Fontibacillus panacisegetis]|uniref:Cysteine desulfurase n=1 Tax=Fontibacillus panacisegetis TaxID=670482 RepID=A0A1G7PQD3_9BACL|nr:cysteine desulfurase family protein [Fontibacillus panacisegetis]SDF88434.1 cysteine desulfurase [Fontibacillus panacisegetis]
MDSLYFDFCASTPLHPEVYDELMHSTKQIFANPSSVHDMGFEANLRVEEARERISVLLQVMPNEVIFTSGATESNNLAILGVVRAWAKKTGQIPHVLTTQVEHSSVYNCCKQLVAEGVEVTFLPVDRNGVVSVSTIEESMQPNTVLVSVMHVNNETGAIQPIQEIGKLLRNKPDIHFHVDGVQGFGKQSLLIEDIDLYTLSGHKIGGPKGIGLLIIKETVELAPLLYGGEQERGIRPGTTNVPGVLSMATAIELTLKNREETMRVLTTLHDLVYSKLVTIPEIIMNSALPPLSSPHIINFSYIGKGITSAILIGILAKQGIVVSSQSACSSKAKASRVLMAITNDEMISSSSIRLSLHESVSLKDAEYLLDSIEKMVNHVKTKNKFELLQGV